MSSDHRNDAVQPNSTSTSSLFPSIEEWDQPFTDQELQAIDAAEAAFLSSSSKIISTPSSSSAKKRHSASQTDGNIKKSRRQKLPTSIVALCKPFSLSPCQGHVKVRLPAMRFGGRIVYSRTKAEVEEAASQLLWSLEKRKGAGKISLGFDIEWKPTFRRGVLPGKAAVMQLCADYKHCHVMHIIHSGITPSLQLLLEDSTIVKVGVGIGGDCVKVFKDYNVSVKTVEDISFLANQKLGGEPRTWGLQSLTERIVCKELHKPNKIRLGNWEVGVLTKGQLEYAATDAFASWHIYEVLKSLPEPQESEKMDEPVVALQ